MEYTTCVSCIMAKKQTDDFNQWWEGSYNQESLRGGGRGNREGLGDTLQYTSKILFYNSGC